MRDVLVNLFCVLGAALIAVGFGLIFMPAGLVTLGAFVLGAAYLIATQGSAVRR